MMQYLGILSFVVLFSSVFFVLWNWEHEHKNTLSDHVTSGRPSLIFTTGGLIYAASFAYFIYQWTDVFFVSKVVLWIGILSFVYGLFVRRIHKKTLRHDISTNIAGSCLTLFILLIVVNDLFTTRIRFLAAVSFVMMLILASQLIKRGTHLYLYKQLTFYVLGLASILLSFHLSK